ncbi:MAG: hypothetical protein DME92_12350 [Verrucomicrobia bacterium]|nr:MAG: hypothetical protein DME92_12350 [Verrucomicrobiota bacterium]
MTKSTPTLTQSGLLAVLLEHQRRKVIELARRRAHREQVRAAFWSILARLLARAHGSIAMFHQIHTYTELRQQIHDDLRAQHPEWVQPNGQSPMCDSYEARLMELLDTFTQRGSNESVGAIHPALQQGLN